MQNVHFRITEIAEIMQAKLVSEQTHDAGIVTLLTDSRNVSVTEGCLFFALVTSRNDGHKYIESLYAQGVRHFVVQYIPDNVKHRMDADFLVVKNTLSALQELVAVYRQRFHIPVVGITGSNGKTIVKEWLAYLLAEDAKVVKSPKSYNSQIGVPLSVWEMQQGDEIAIFEAGLSQPGEMEHNWNVIKPTIGLFTNVGTAHDEHFMNGEQKIEEKLKLFRGAEMLVYSTNHLDVKRQIENREELKNIPAFTWGHDNHSTLQILDIVSENGKVSLTARYKNEKLELSIPYPDKASVENAMHCWAFMLMMGYEQDTIFKRMQNLPVIEMRMELKEAINNCSVINDSYSSDYNSLQIAVDFLNQQQQHAKKTVILSDILQTGRDKSELYTEVSRLLKTRNVDRIIGVGPEISKQADKFDIEKFFYPDTETFLKEFPFSQFNDETILLKGARKFAFETIGKALQQKAHETVLEINLNALAHNLNYFRSKLLPGVKLMAMVKAFSYGSGSFEIANLLQFHQADYLTVAYTDEGVELRKSGISMPIMVMNPEEQSFDKILEYDLEPEIYSFRILTILSDKLKRWGKTKNAIPVHIKLDTGMHRLGFEEKDVPPLLEALKIVPEFRIASVFSHLVASGNPELDWFTQQQIEKFKRMETLIKSAFAYPIYSHILNSSGVSRFPDAQFDMVRLGIGFYGVAANEEEQKQLQHVSTLKTVISQIKHIPKGDTVGYDRNYTAERETVVATIPVGYADGLNRHFGNGCGHVIVNGLPAPVIGSICMDMCMVDITGIEAEENDEVIIFGKEQPITTVAKVLDTIPYEVLTGISRRVKRIYYQE
jgi:alanine racemase